MYCFMKWLQYFLFVFLCRQTLAECKQRPAFNRLLKLYEEKPVCSGRRLENYLTAPMHRVSPSLRPYKHRGKTMHLILHRILSSAIFSLFPPYGRNSYTTEDKSLGRSVALFDLEMLD